MWYPSQEPRRSSGNTYLNRTFHMFVNIDIASSKSHHNLREYRNVSWKFQHNIPSQSQHKLESNDFPNFPPLWDMFVPWRLFLRHPSVSPIANPLEIYRDPRRKGDRMRFWITQLFGISSPGIEEMTHRRTFFVHNFQTFSFDEKKPLIWNIWGQRGHPWGGVFIFFWFWFIFCLFLNVHPEKCHWNAPTKT